jgi:bacillithiol biosynthesis cysteine-adding enzyme BshC
MPPACLRHTEIPGTSRLFTDFLYCFDKVKGFYPAPAFDLAAYLDAAGQISLPDSRRAALVAALAEINPGSELLDTLAEPGSVVVATGQQNGLYGGPAYTVYKALTAVAIARQLTAAGRKAVPVFWVATEDHDFAEIDHSWMFNAAGEPVRVRAPGRAQPQEPVGGIALDSVPSEEMAAALRDLPFGDEVLALANLIYSPGRTFGEVFREIVARILRPHQVLFLDPLRESIRHLAAPFLAEAARRSDELLTLAAARSRELTRAGYHAQVLIDEKGGSLFFELRQEADGRLRRSAVKKPDVAALADSPERLSPNALLRPVLQDFLLPAAVMVGGPAELAYLAQSAPLYQALLGRQSVPVPRASATLIDPRSAKVLERTGLRIPEVLAPADTVRDRIAARLTPPSVQAAFEQTARVVEQSLGQWSKELTAFDPSLAAALDKSRGKIRYQLEKTAAKVARESLRRDERAAADAATLIHRIYPHRHLQERLYSILPFLAAHGLDLPGRIYENIHLDCPDHHLLWI